MHCQLRYWVLSTNILQQFMQHAQMLTWQQLLSPSFFFCPAPASVVNSNNDFITAVHLKKAVFLITKSIKFSVGYKLVVVLNDVRLSQRY